MRRSDAVRHLIVAAPAGPCEVCGGPQNWTIYAGEMYVRCVYDCSEQLVIEGFETLPLDSEDPGYGFVRDVVGTLEREGVVPRSGGETRMSDSKDCELPF